ncbi:MAG: DUF935 domain-containing protein [Desulfovibrio sp.]|nr:DUF935 domain-containing protein [Desulfovibrio sp.]
MSKKLYDAYGNPIETELLTEELAGPTVTGVRTPIAGHPSHGLTPEYLAGLMLEAEQGNEQAYLELAEEMEEKDLHYRAVLSTRRLQVSGLEITVDAASDNKDDVKAADLVRECIAAIRPALFDILDAVGKGFSVCEIFWNTEGRQWMPERLAWRDPRWFGFEPTTGEGPLLRDETGLLTPLAPAKFVTHVCRSKSGLPIRGGLARAAAWAWLFKNFDLKSWVLFCEIYGHPLRVGKYGPSATESDKKTLLRAVRNISSDHAAIVPDSMVLEFIDAKAQGNVQVFRQLAEYLDMQISKLVLGQTGTTDTGSRVGTADAHERVRADIERSDADQLAATLNRDVVRPLILLNFGEGRALPTLKMFRPEKKDLDGMTNHLSRLVPLGLRVGMSEVRDRLGFPDPGENEECLGAPVATPEPEQPGDSGDSAVDVKEPREKSAHSAGMPDIPFEAERDWIDDLTDETLDGWRPLTEPLIKPVMDLADSATTLQEFEDGLAGLAMAQDTRQMALALGRSLFVARATSEAGKGNA